MAKKDEELTQVWRQLLEALERRLEPISTCLQGHNIITYSRENDPNYLFERFRKRAPKEFTGQEDPLTAGDWLAHMENIFEVFICSGRQHVQLAASMFIGLAEIWWKTIKAAYQNIENDQAWTMFKDQFSEKCVPAHIKRQKAIEFQQLKHGNMTFLEYVTKFERLSR